GDHYGTGENRGASGGTADVPGRQCRTRRGIGGQWHLDDQGPGAEYFRLQGSGLRPDRVDTGPTAPPHAVRPDDRVGAGVGGTGAMDERIDPRSGRRQDLSPVGVAAAGWGS